MEAIFPTAANRPALQPLADAAADWLRATRTLARVALRAVCDAAVNASRAGLLLENGSRPRRLP